MKKILIIDDEKDFCFFIKKNLELDNNYEVVTAFDAASGVKKAAWDKPDVILLDIIMPKDDGFNALKELKDNRQTLEIPVIMLTAKGELEYKKESTMLYSEDYIVKPVEIAELKDKIEEVLERNKGKTP